jgi:hypothetical protein
MARPRIHFIAPDSVLSNYLCIGEKLIAIDGVDVTQMPVFNVYHTLKTGALKGFIITLIRLELSDVKKKEEDDGFNAATLARVTATVTATSPLVQAATTKVPADEEDSSSSNDSDNAIPSKKSMAIKRAKKGSGGNLKSPESIIAANNAILGRQSVPAEAAAHVAGVLSPLSNIYKSIKAPFSAINSLFASTGTVSTADANTLVSGFSSNNSSIRGGSNGSRRTISSSKSTNARGSRHTIIATLMGSREFFDT